LRVGMKNGEFIVDPPEGEVSDLDLNIAAKPGAVLMVEAGANFLTEEQMLDAITHAHKLMEPLFEAQEEIRRAIGKQKREDPPPARYEALVAEVTKVASPLVAKAFAIPGKQDRTKALKKVDDEVMTQVNPDGDSGKKRQVKAVLEELQYRYL